VRQRYRWWIAVFCGLASVLAFMFVLYTRGWAAPADPEDRISVPAVAAPTLVPQDYSAIVRWADGDDYPNCRLGVGVRRNDITTYDYAPLRLGWYIDWNARMSPVKPDGMDYYHTVWVKQNRSGGNYLPTYSASPPLDFSPGGLGTIVQANPGSLWIVGNEPDVTSQGDTMPDMYAQIYHDVYSFVKSTDPTAKVAIGAVVQPTPLRLQYLDLVLSEYRARYGTSMPVDVWNTHLYIVQEKRDDYGAHIPPGIDATVGRLYTRHDHLDVNVLQSLVVELRTWMQERGYENMPLIVTEFGALMPLWFLDDVGLTQDDINNFIGGATSYMDSATDVDLGYAADNYRLVQQAALYSIDDDSVFDNSSASAATVNPFEQYLRRYGGALGFLSPDEIPYRWGSFLFHSTPPYTRTATGDYYAGFAASLPASVDLLPYRAFADPGSLIISAGGTTSATFKGIVSNAGNSTPSMPVTVRFLDVTAGDGTQVGSDVTLSPFTGCGALREASVVWPNLSPGLHSMRIEVDPHDQISESLESNNVMTKTVLVGTHGIYLPAVRR
jgi:hypothetical protein